MSPFESVWCEVSSEDEGFSVSLIGQDARDGMTDMLLKRFVRDRQELGETADEISRAARMGQCLIDAEYEEARRLGEGIDRRLRTEVITLVVE